MSNGNLALMIIIIMCNGVFQIHVHKNLTVCFTGNFEFSLSL